MLRYVPRIFTAELLEVLLELRKDQAIVLADSMFPAKMPNGPLVIEFGGDDIGQLLKALFGFLSIYSPAIMMKPDEGEGKGNPGVRKKYARIIKEKRKKFKIERVGRQEFYERAKRAAFIVRTRDCTPWANIILKRGLLPAPRMRTCLSPRCFKELHLLGHGQGIVICNEKDKRKLSGGNIPFIQIQESMLKVLEAALTYVPPDTFLGCEPIIPTKWEGKLTLSEAGTLQSPISRQWPKAPHLKSIGEELFRERASTAALILVGTGEGEKQSPVMLFKGNKTKF